ncbi:hypothetical protein L6452_38732 [Arctium lappa]|uniref:Uncharacterized protein n=1 Tax=Arctium lappa TaxID=4217 RepID=A0ACB8XQC0_ARCLA|nr:hypothetical protein L6452_38732 [Arctium lappa]
MEHSIAQKIFTQVLKLMETFSKRSEKGLRANNKVVFKGEELLHAYYAFERDLSALKKFDNLALSSS